MSALVEKFYRWLIALGGALQSPLLLAIRLFWGWQFFLTGKGKLMDLAKPTQFFESLVTADEFLFLFAAVIIFVFGPGAFSLDALIGKYFKRHAERGS